MGVGGSVTFSSLVSLESGFPVCRSTTKEIVWFQLFAKNRLRAKESAKSVRARSGRIGHLYPDCQRVSALACTATAFSLLGSFIAPTPRDRMETRAVYPLAALSPVRDLLLAGGSFGFALRRNATHRVALLAARWPSAKANAA